MLCYVFLRSVWFSACSKYVMVTPFFAVMYISCSSTRSLEKSRSLSSCYMSRVTRLHDIAHTVLFSSAIITAAVFSPAKVLLFFFPSFFPSFVYM